ncbi:MAG: O-antigen ligase family protein [Bacteroidales bacterium]|nr:O-antigen ligase family protein [Bacteroidales bacterium]MDT8373780.1 O-antigen ligase family protein [Bacteroidales bacterium]
MDADTNITRKNIHRGIYIASLCLIAIFLPSSRYMLTVSEILLAVNWVAEGSFRTRFSRLRSDRAAIAFILIYILSVVGVIWSEDPVYAFRHDLLHKLPTLFMPLIVATSVLPGRRMTRVILLLFISSVVVVSFIGFFSRLTEPDASYREASPFIPGLYLGLMVIIAAFQLPLLARAGADRMLRMRRGSRKLTVRKSDTAGERPTPEMDERGRESDIIGKKPIPASADRGDRPMPGKMQMSERADVAEGSLPAPDDEVNLPLPAWVITGSRKFFVASLAISAWLIFFLFHLRTLSGVASFAAALICLTAVLAARSKGILLKIFLPALLIIVTALAAGPTVTIWRQTHSETPVIFNSLDSRTSRGNPYLHDTLNIIRENGNPVYLYIADGELREAWNAKSTVDYDGTNLAGLELRATLFRYMSSLGLRKDAEDFMSLNDKDIAAVERGVTNHLNLNRPGFYVRAYEEMMSLYLYYESSRQMTEWGSLTKRIDLWRASWEAFRERPLLGWGTGSILPAVEHGLQKNGSTLSGLNMKPHSQYLYIMVTLGVAGLIITVLLYAFFVVRRQAHRSLIFILFLAVFLVNFLGNNSLESQPGQDLFVFFSMIYGYFYLHAERQE